MKFKPVLKLTAKKPKFQVTQNLAHLTYSIYIILIFLFY